MLFAYWGLNTWLPGFLSAPRSQGGAGLNVIQTSTWIFIMQFGTFLGYASFGWLADWWGRRPGVLRLRDHRRRAHAHLRTHARLGRSIFGILAARSGAAGGILRHRIFLAVRNHARRALPHVYPRLRARLRL